MLVEQEHIASALENGVSGRETGETASDNDNLSHFDDE